MTNLQEMQRNTVRLCHDKLKKFCEPLVICFDVNHFYHTRLSHSGRLVNLGLAVNWEEFFISSAFALQWPTLRNPQLFKSDIVLLKIFDDETTTSQLQVARNQFNINYSFELIYKTNEGQETFGFGLKSPNPIHQIAFIKEIPLLRLFIKRYKEEFKSHINTFRDYEVDFGSLIGPAFNQTLIDNENEKRNQFLQKMGIGTLAHLSHREKDVIKYLTKGYTASQISKELFISTRTVEHHLEHLKDKLDCFSKSELIQKALELELIGCF
ncbi:MAG: helix-turn-helix transcriptional regulator [Chlamydiales bacterium]